MAIQKKKKEKIKLPKGIREKGNRFLVDITVGGVRKTAMAATIEEALEKRETLKGGLALARKNSSGGEGCDSLKIIAKGGWTLEQAFERAFADYWRGKSSEGTNTINSNAAMQFFGKDKLIATLTQTDIDNYADHLEKSRNSNATINRKMSALSRLLQAAKKRGHKPREELTFTRRREPVGRIRFLSAKEEEKLLEILEYLGKPDHLEATIVLLDTGFRTGELWRLEAHQVNFIQNSITLWKTKNFQPRTVYMTCRVRDIMMRRCMAYPKGQLFPGSDKVWMRSSWGHVRQLMGMEANPDFVPHMLRHTCCSRLVQRGVPLAHVKDWMGHNDIKTTMRYAHLAPQDLFSIVSVLEGGDQARWDRVRPSDMNDVKTLKQ